MRVFICLIGLACVGMLSPELAAQAPPSQPATQAPPSRVPLVDELEADPQQRLVELTLALYQVVIEAQEQSCLELGGEVRSFLDLNEAEIEAQALALQQDLALLSEDALAERAQELALAFALPEVAPSPGGVVVVPAFC